MANFNPATPEDVLDEWHKDAQNHHKGNDLLELAKFHEKYERVLSRHAFKAKSAGDNLKVLKKNKWLWIGGKLSREDLDRLGWAPFEMKLVKSQYDMFINSDPDVIKLGQVHVFHEEMVRLCGSIIWAIKQRGEDVGNAIRYEKFLAGD